MGIIIGGKYNGYKIYCNRDYKYLYIKVDDVIVGITKRNISAYKERSQNGLSDAIYAIEWQKGERSLIKIPRSWSEIMISGCEFGPLDEESSRKNRENSRYIFASILSCIIIVACVITGVMISRGDTNNVVSSSQPKTTRKKWYVWDKESTPEEADVVIIMGEFTSGYGGIGTMGGSAKNFTSKTLSYIQITIGLYAGEAKVGSCFANQSYLSPDTYWNFEATCTNSSSASSYKVEDVTYW